MITTELVAQMEKEEASVAGLTILEYKKRIVESEMEKKRRMMEDEKLSRR